MSRSYKKTPIHKDKSGAKFGKKFANRKVRNYKSGIPNGKKYRLLYNSWDISDWYSRTPKIEMLADYEAEQNERLNNVMRWHRGEQETLKEAVTKWKKYYYRK